MAFGDGGRGRCPCGTGAALTECCGPLLDGAAQAATAEQLMRSRYCAFALGRVDHLVRSWHPATRPADLQLDPRTRWTGLRILRVREGGPDDDTGVVAFAASHSGPDGDGVLEETSLFSRRGRRRWWVYERALTDG